MVLNSTNTRPGFFRGARRLLRPVLDVLEERTVLTNSPIVVNSLADILSPPSGTVTLRSAIQQANSQPGGNEIDLSLPGTYAITIPGANTGTNASGPFQIQTTGGDLTINNTSKNTSGQPAAVAIDAGGLDRVFDVNPGAEETTLFNVTIQGVTIQNGQAAGTSDPAGAGGGIRVQGGAILTLDNDTITHCSAGTTGGGVAIVGGGIGTLSVSNSQFLNNTAGTDGGAILDGGAGTITTITNSLFQGNAARNGGAIENPGSNLQLFSCTFDGNSALSGSGVADTVVPGPGGNGGALDLSNPTGSTFPLTYTIQNDWFTNNKAIVNTLTSPPSTGDGGAIDHRAGSLTLTTSQFSGNLASGGGGAINSAGLTLNLSESVFTGNASGTAFPSSSAADPGHGGALDVKDTGTLANSSGSSVANSTFTTNTAALNGGAIADGGPGDLNLINATINANTAANEAGGGGVALLGGATPGRFQVLNTILYGNTSTGTGALGPDVATLNGATVSDQGGNLVGTVGQNNSGFGAGTLTANPLLGPLLDNGGPFAGMNPSGSFAADRVVVSSEAINAQSPAFGKGVVSTLYQGVDGRGFPRPGAASAKPSIGAFEPQVLHAPSIPYVIASDGQVYDRDLSTAETPQGGYLLSAYGQTTALAVTRFGSGLSTEAFVIGSDQQVYAETFDASNNQRGYFATAAGAVQSIAVGTDASGNPLLFVISTSSDGNQLYEVKFDSNGNATSGSYVKAAYGNFKQVIVTHDASGNPLLYAIGTDNLVYGLQMNASGTPIGGLFRMGTGTVNQLAVGHDASNHPEVFVVGTDAGLGKPGYVYTIKANASGNPVSGYNSGIGGPVLSISLTSDGSNNPELFAIGTDNQPYSHLFNAAGNPVGKFNSLGGMPGGVSALAAGSDASGNPALYVIETANSQVYSLPFNAAGNASGTFTLTTAGMVRKIVLA